MLVGETLIFGPEVTLSRKLKQDGYNPAIYKCTVPGTSLSSFWKEPGENGAYDQMKADLLNQITILKNQGYKVNLRAFIWIQGEEDASSQTMANNYKAKLAKIIYDFRNSFGNVPIILSVNNSCGGYINTIIQSQMDISNEFIDVNYSDMIDLERFPSDQIHLSAIGVINQGEKLYQSLTTIPFNPLLRLDYNFVWEDNFTTLNPNRWAIAHRFDHFREPQIYLNSQVTNSINGLTISLKRQEYLDPNPDLYHCERQYFYSTNHNLIVPYEFISGWMESIDKVKIPINSYVESKITFPYANQFFPAFWLFGGKDYNDPLQYEEIDIVEQLGHISPTKITNNNHTKSIFITKPNETNFEDKHSVSDFFEGNIKTKSGQLLNYEETALVFGMRWDQDNIYIYVNGILQVIKPNNGLYNPKTIIYNFALTPINKDMVPVSPTVVPNDVNLAKMKVEYIKVWENNTNKIPLENKQPYIINPLIDVHHENKFLSTVRWQINDLIFNSSSKTCKIIYGNSPTNLNLTIDNIYQISADHLYSIVLNELTANTKYYYKIIINGLSLEQPFSQTFSFISPPSSNATSTKFYAYGGTQANQTGIAPANHNDVCQSIKNEQNSDPSSQTLLVHTGDWNFDDKEINWMNGFFNNTDQSARNLISNITIMGINGNETGSLGNRKYFPFPYSGNLVTGNKWSYSYDYGPIHFLMLNIESVGHELNEAEKQWIDYDLEKTTKRWKIIVLHIPLKSLSNNVAGQGTVDYIKLKSKEYNVQAVIMGHENYYAHWVESGTHYLILGAGGNEIDPINNTFLQNSNEIFAATVPSFAKFDIQGDIMKVDIIQGKTANGYNSGRRIEKFSIPYQTDINGTLTFNNPIDYPIVTDKLNVLTGSQLNIYSPVNFVNNGLATVYKGAILNITGSNATLTNFTRIPELINYSNNTANNYSENNTLWNGIYVLGDKQQSQFTQTNQGVLYVLNNASIKNAYTAISVGLKANLPNPFGGTYISIAGGIINLNSANFENCKTSIWMNTYHNYINKTEYANASHIYNCNFVVNDNMVNNSFGKNFIELYELGPIHINGNTFSDNSTRPAPLAMGGILSINTAVKINKYPNKLVPGVTYFPNIFNRLGYGIRCYNSSTISVITIKDNIFNNCYKSVFLNNTNTAEITKNTITVSSEIVGEINLPYGIYINSGNGFKVEENIISGNTDAAFGSGIIINNTGALENEIYNNQLSYLKNGIKPQDFNHDGNENVDIGLRLFCNKNNNNPEYDFVVAVSIDNLGLLGTGIGKVQQMAGNNNNYLDAGNTFSQNHAAYDWDFSNVYVSEPINYYYKSGSFTDRFEPIYVNNIINKEVTINLNSCPSKTGIRLDPITTMYQMWTAADVQKRSSKLLLDIWRNGGNVELGEEVRLTDPWEAYQQFNALMAVSPNLGEDALVEFVNNPVFSSLMVKLLLVANPQASRSGIVLDALYNRIPAMPEAYIQAILNEEGTASQLEQLENNYAADEHLYRTFVEDIKFAYRQDTINTYATDSLIAFMSRLPYVEDKYELAMQYIESGMNGNATDVLNLIPIVFELNEQQNIDYQHWTNTFTTAKDMYANEKYIGSLEDADVIALTEIVAANRSGVSSYALGLLKRNNPDFDYSEVDIMVNPSQTRKSKPSNQQNAIEKEIIVKIYPNPALDYLTLEYKTLGISYTHLFVKIRDVNKKLLLSQELKKGDNTEMIGLNNLKSGNYIVELIADSKVIASEKLTVTK